MNEQQIRKYLVSNILDKVVIYVIEDMGVDALSAMNLIYSSPVIGWLEDPEQDLCSQSPAYIYELIKRHTQA